MELLHKFLFFGNGMGIGIVLGLIGFPSWALFTAKSQRTQAFAGMLMIVLGSLFIVLVCFIILYPEVLYQIKFPSKLEGY